MGHRRRHKEKTTEISRQFISARIALVVFYGTFGLLMFGPLAFGAVEPWSIFILETGAVMLTVLWLAKQCSTTRSRSCGIPSSSPWPPSRP
jgi:hypothetical protein